MVKVKNFSGNIEKDLNSLGKAVEKTRERVGESHKEREIVKESIKSLPVGGGVSGSGNGTPTPSPNYLKGSSGDEGVREKVEELVEMTLRDGLEKGLREAKKQTPFIEDAYHDALVDKLLPELKKRGLIK